MELRIARIGKPHGVHGEATVELLTDTPEDRFHIESQFTLYSPLPDLKRLTKS